MDAEEIAKMLPPSREIKRIYLSELGETAATDAIVEAFDAGSSMLSFVGHGGIHLWTSENIFNIWMVDHLAPQPQQPVLLTMNCLNGYFHFPFFNSLAEELVKADGKGAIAAFSPSGLSLSGPAGVFHEALITALVSEGHERLGDAILAAQTAYADKGAFPELLRIYHLFGDPALKLR